MPTFMEKLLEHTEPDRLKCAEILSKIPESELRLLKGHLLVEEQLNHLIEFKAETPRVLNKARFSFLQKVHLVEALYFNELTFPSWLSSAASQLNKCRNLLAHTLDEKQLLVEQEKLHNIFYAHKLIKRDCEPELSLSAFCIGSIVTLYSGLYHTHQELAKLPEAIQAMPMDMKLTSLKLRAQWYI